MRADSGFYTHTVVSTCREVDVRFSITIRQHASLRDLMEAIPDEDWTPIPYWMEGAADVAETTYTPFQSESDAAPVRLIVRRVRPTPGSQLALFATYSYHAFITDRDGETLELEADHRRHAEIENAIRDLKYGVGLNHMPSGRFAANSAWLAVQVMTHNLARWTARIGLGERIVTTKTLRRRFFSLAASPCIFPRVGHGRAMYAAPWHGCERFHSRPDDPSATDPPSPQTRATPVRECLLLRPRPSISPCATSADGHEVSLRCLSSAAAPSTRNRPRTIPPRHPSPIPLL